MLRVCGNCMRAQAGAALATAISCSFSLSGPAAGASDWLNSSAGGTAWLALRMAF